MGKSSSDEEARVAQDELREGRFRFTPEEREAQVRELEARGMSREDALREVRERELRATARLRKEQGKKAVKEFEDFMNRGGGK